MTDTLWNDLDSYLVDILTTDLGPVSAYTTLQAQLVTATTYEQFLAPNTGQRDKESQLPGIFIVGNVAKFDDGQFGDGKLHLVASMPYDIFCLAQDTSWPAALADAKTLGTRVRESLRARPNLLYLGSTPQSSIGEVVRRTLIGGLDVWVLKVAGAGGLWRGLARVSVEIEAQA